MSHKTCCQCEISKSLADFQRRKDAKDGRAYFCKECAKLRRRKRNEKYKKERLEITCKVCSTCKEEKEVCEFFKHATVFDGYRPECKICNKERAAKSSEKYSKNRVEISQKKCARCGIVKAVDRFAKNKYKTSGLNSTCKDCHSVYYQENKESILAQAKKYREGNYEYVTQVESEYRARNKNRINEVHRVYQAKRKREDISFRVSCALRNFANKSISRGSKKKARCKELFGVSLNNVKLWLEMNFEDGMSWSNYGLNGWTIDHIIPCSKFDLSDVEEQKRCMHWSNLTPMWQVDNNAKNNKTLQEFLPELDRGKYPNLLLRIDTNGEI